jgi:hypothetical protein
VAKRGDAYEFAYPYVFYFFLGRWLARHLEDAGVKTKVEDCARRLDVRKNASAILFLSYHSNNRWIIETIASALVDCMPSCKAIDLDKDICFINELADTSSRILIAAPDVGLNQTEARKIQDGLESMDQPEAAASDSHEEETPDDGIVELRRLNLLFKTAEILGQIIKNYYGSLEREIKEEKLDQVMEAPLRVLRRFFELVGNDPDGFVKGIEDAFLRERAKDLTPSELRDAAREISYNLLGVIATGFILRTGSWVGSRRIEEDVENVIQRHDSTARRLIQ